MHLTGFYVLLLTSYCASYDVSITSTCTKYTNGTCSVWVHSGGVGDSTECFPGTMFMLGGSGIGVPMKELQLGEKVLTPCGLETVRLWLHRVSQYDMKYTTLHTDLGYVTLSQYHNIAINNTGNYVFAQDIRVNDTLVTSDGRRLVHHISYDMDDGLYAPYTTCGSFYVGNSRYGLFYEVHAFAHVRNPSSYNSIFTPILRAAEFVDADINNVTSEIYVHPLAEKLEWLFGDLLMYKGQATEATEHHHARKVRSVPHTQTSASTNSNNRNRKKAAQAFTAAFIAEFVSAH